MGDPKGFIKYRRSTPERLPVAERIHSWKEFYQPFPAVKLKNQAARCMDCGVPFCQSSSGCPVENLIPDWNDLVFRDRWEDALKSLHSTNNFPEFTGKLCPAPCESACVLGIPSDPVAIRNIESAIIERGFNEGWVRPEPPAKRTGRRVAIIGSGPCGLAAAQQLSRAGHSVTVFEKAAKPGGLLRYGIPEFKMEKTVLDRRLDQLRAEGIEFRTGTHVGVSFPAEALRSDFDAVCVASGAERARDLPIRGRDLRGVHLAMDYLIHQNLTLEGAPSELDESMNAYGKHVVVIGGGDTGSDCIGTAHRQGCLSVTQLEILPEPPMERSPNTPWPYWPMRLRTSHAHEEGCDRKWNVSATECIEKNGAVHALRMLKVNDRFEPEGGQESGVEIRADLVLLAVGFTGPVTEGLIQQLGVGLDTRGNLVTDARYMTTVNGVFAAGDARRGASLIVWAIAEGRKMADAVHQYLTGPSENT
ncbi:MAG: glutamate synthase subunit beta [Oligoflexia bacterium]|nr:glutamate synthase subunit beta [Oligoflexia bacterium]